MSGVQLSIDERNLEALPHGLVFSPAVIALNIDKSRSEVNRRLTKVVDIGFVERVKCGYYEIRDAGEQYLYGDLDPDEF